MCFRQDKKFVEIQKLNLSFNWIKIPISKVSKQNITIQRAWEMNSKLKSVCLFKHLYVNDNLLITVPKIKSLHQFKRQFNNLYALRMIVLIYFVKHNSKEKEKLCLRSRQEVTLHSSLIVWHKNSFSP